MGPEKEHFFDKRLHTGTEIHVYFTIRTVKNFLRSETCTDGDNFIAYIRKRLENSKLEKLGPYSVN